MGPNTEPCGTPDATGTWSDIAPSRTTYCFLFDRNLFNQVNVVDSVVWEFVKQCPDTRLRSSVPK